MDNRRGGYRWYLENPPEASAAAVAVGGRTQLRGPSRSTAGERSGDLRIQGTGVERADGVDSHGGRRGHRAAPAHPLRMACVDVDHLEEVAVPTAVVAIPG